MQVPITSFDELTEEWDKVFLPEKSREVGLLNEVKGRFLMHFSKDFLHQQFYDDSLPELRPKESFEKVLQDSHPHESLDTHKKSRTSYLNSFRERGISIPKNKKASIYLLEYLLSEWNSFCQNQVDQLLYSAQPEKTVFKLLTHLNCCDQRRIFKDFQDQCLEQQVWASAYVLRVEGELGKWFIGSLLQSVGGYLDTQIIVNYGKKIYDHGFDYFWDNVGSSVVKNYENLKLENGVLEEQILEGLCKKIERQSVVVIIEEVNKIGGPNLIRIRDEFWLKLVERLRKLSDSEVLSSGFKLLMLSEELSGESIFKQRWTTNLVLKELPDQLSDDFFYCPIELAALLEIPRKDIKSWLRRYSVDQFLRKHSSGEALALQHKKLISLPNQDYVNGNPRIVLDKICYQLLKKNLESLDISYEKVMEIVAA